MTTTPALTDLTGDYVLDPAHTRIGFIARHAMVTKVRGAFHQFEGTAHLDGADPARSTAQVVIKAESIDTGVEQRDQHLRTNDFRLPRTRHHLPHQLCRGAVRHRVPRHRRPDHQGHHSPVTIDFEYTGNAVGPYGNLRVGLEGSVTISRKEYGVTWNAALEGGGVLVGDKVVLEFDISAIKQK
ncbi:YceI family protein [Streptomyces vinaceus]|uniref:YceI family protein n=1 Tax=Streptomyces vinaceus TaxID=1960 RepID=UPI0036A650CC